MTCSALLSATSRRWQGTAAANAERPAKRHVSPAAASLASSSLSRYPLPLVLVSHPPVSPSPRGRALEPALRGNLCSLLRLPSSNGLRRISLPRAAASAMPPPPFPSAACASCYPRLSKGAAPSRASVPIFALPGGGGRRARCRPFHPRGTKSGDFRVLALPNSTPEPTVRISNLIVTVLAF